MILCCGVKVHLVATPTASGACTIARVGAGSNPGDGYATLYNIATSWRFYAALQSNRCRGGWGAMPEDNMVGENWITLSKGTQSTCMQGTPLIGLSSVPVYQMHAAEFTKQAVPVLSSSQTRRASPEGRATWRLSRHDGIHRHSWASPLMHRP